MTMSSEIPTLEDLADRLERNATWTIAALEAQAELTTNLAILRKKYEAYVGKVGVELEETNQLDGKTVGERNRQRQQMVSEELETIDFLERIGARERVQTKRTATLEGYRIERGVLGQLLRIREMADTAERAQGQRRHQRRAWKRRR